MDCDQNLFDYFTGLSIFIPIIFQPSALSLVQSIVVTLALIGENVSVKFCLPDAGITYFSPRVHLSTL